MNETSTASALYTQECDFEQAIQTHIAALWASREEGYFSTKDNKQLFWCSLTNPKHNKALLVVNGRIESAWKYQELFYDFYQQGYDVYSFDHRGQGLSTHLAPDPQMGHIIDFDDYINDMDALVAFFSLSRYQERMILAHSMGGAIATRYIQTHPNHGFDKIALSAPMYGVNVPWYFKPLAITISQIMTALYSTPTYAPGYRSYAPKPFEVNPLSQSLVRYQWFRRLYEDKPELKIGGPSTQWVWQGLMAAKQCIQQTRQISIPLLLVQAGEDKIVCNDAQIKFVHKLQRTNPKARSLTINGAKHEVLFESDQYRNAAMSAIGAFFNNQTDLR